jgi:hypothetical protein
MVRTSGRMFASLLLLAVAMPAGFASEYTLMPTTQTVAIGNFSAATKPALTISSGGTVVLETVASMDPGDRAGAVPASAVPQQA